MTPPIVERPDKQGAAPLAFPGGLAPPVIELLGPQFDHSNPTEGRADPPESRDDLVGSTNTRHFRQNTKQDRHI